MPAIDAERAAYRCGSVNQSVDINHGATVDAQRPLDHACDDDISSRSHDEVGDDAIDLQITVDDECFDSVRETFIRVSPETLYRIPTELLRNQQAKPRDVEAGVEKVAKTFPTDGLWMDKDDNLYTNSRARAPS